MEFLWIIRKYASDIINELPKSIIDMSQIEFEQNIFWSQFLPNDYDITWIFVNVCVDNYSCCLCNQNIIEFGEGYFRGLFPEHKDSKFMCVNCYTKIINNL